MLKINRITKLYGRTEVLKEVSLNIPKGTCFGLVGPNGAGKSTLLKILASIIHEYQGSIHFVDHQKIKIKKKVGYVPQEISLEQALSAYNNLCFFGRLYGLKGKELKKRATVVLKEIGLTERGNDKVMHFSGGMKRRLNIGCALMHKPKLIIMDEPTVGIDPQSRRYIFGMIKRLIAEGSTIIYATHYMEEVERLCHHVAFIDHGKIIEKGNIDELMQRYATPSVFVKGIKELPKCMNELGQVLPYQGGYLVTTDKPVLVMEDILHNYRDHPDELKRLELVQPRLEDVFFSLTGSEFREVKSHSREEVI